jgi:hypothetical protein
VPGNESAANLIGDAALALHEHGAVLEGVAHERKSFDVEREARSSIPSWFAGGEARRRGGERRPSRRLHSPPCQQPRPSRPNS